MTEQPKFFYTKCSINCYTFKVPQIRKWVENQCRDRFTLNLFAGPTRLSIGEVEKVSLEVTNDLDKEMNTDYHMEALEFLKWWSTQELVLLFDAIILDPPYSYRKSMEYYNGNTNKESKFKLCLDLIPDLLAPNGKVITFGYHSSQMGKCRGFKVDEIAIFDHSGAIHSTLATVESRIGNDIK